MPETVAISAQALSDAIGAIYDCALEPDNWPKTMRHLAELTSSAAMGMGIIDHKHKQNMRLYDYGYSEADLRIYYEKYAALNPMSVARLVYPVGEPVTAEMLLGEQELLESRVYIEYWKPRRIRHLATVELLRTAHRSAGTALVRKDGQPPYSIADLELLRLLAPHLIRAVTISDVLDLRTLKSEMLETTLDTLAAGVFLTARDGRIVYMNAAAERQLKTGSAFRVVNNRLSAADPGARTALASAIDTAATYEKGAGSGGHTLAIPDTDGAGYVATLLPLERGRRQSIVAPFTASVAIFTQSPSEAPAMPGEAFAKLYQLTGGELRVLLVLARGVGAKEAADMLGISEPTVRTHLQQMFSKTGTSRQTDLLRLLQSSAPPNRADQPA